MSYYLFISSFRLSMIFLIVFIWKTSTDYFPEKFSIFSDFDNLIKISDKYSNSLNELISNIRMVKSLPLNVSALATSETFNVGDSVSVALYEGYKNNLTTKNGIGFHVVKESKAGEETVTLIYDGSITRSMSVYDEAIPGTHDASTVLEEAVIRQKLQVIVNKKFNL